MSENDPNFARAEIDSLLAESKGLMGQPSWQQTARSDQLRWGGLLSIRGVACGLKLALDAYPSEADAPFVITLSKGSAIWRVEGRRLCSHMNRSPVPPGIELGIVSGPHQHSWYDNRHLSRGGSLPVDLLFAKQLAPNLRGMQNCLRWFCDEVNIEIGSYPDYPKSERLL
jgi:hypothetical protein